MTQTQITAEHGPDGPRVVVRHSEPVGTQWMTPAQARAMADALQRCADAAEIAQGAVKN